MVGVLTRPSIVAGREETVKGGPRSVQRGPRLRTVARSTGTRINERGSLRAAGPHEWFRVLVQLPLPALNCTAGVRHRSQCSVLRHLQVRVGRRTDGRHIGDRDVERVVRAWNELGRSVRG